jgi:hypothetical protein
MCLPGSDTTWPQQAYLKAPNAEGGDEFGGMLSPSIWWYTAVSISGDSIVLGASKEDYNQAAITNGTAASSDNSADDSGAAYVFNRSGTIWSHEAYLKAPNVEAGDRFGNSVSISGDTIIVGALKESSNQTSIVNGTTASSDNTASDSGAAYVFVRQ